MAIPKVFISSTCFDLSEIREQLSKFVSSFGFDPILSDHGDVFYHPDLHTHEACVHEVSNCQLFILIIGGRFGGQYLADKEKSITNAEYKAAKNANIPVFTYIKSDVLSNHHIYSTNSKSDIADKINYPAIQKKEDAVNIFNFINEVRKESRNNGYEGFSNFSDIENHLRKQWAGMFFEFLKTREIKSQIDATNHLLSNLKNSNNKLEEIVKSLYISSSKDSKEAQESINSIENNSLMMEFFDTFHSLLINSFHSTIDFLNTDINDQTHIKIAKISPKGKSWSEYISALNIFELDFKEAISTENDININEEKNYKSNFFENNSTIDPGNLNNYKPYELSFKRVILVISKKYRISFKVNKYEEKNLSIIFNRAIMNTNTEDRLQFYKGYIEKLNLINV
ncbi:DUF4062 domain-containing protein [Marinomonas sp.]|uniref:DUF4062 domain-containing protein n=1 Tax=Marinomonas sp. TaxID=1904862 RepID=UPI003A93A074